MIREVGERSHVIGITGVISKTLIITGFNQRNALTVGNHQDEHRLDLTLNFRVIDDIIVVAGGGFGVFRMDVKTPLTNEQTSNGYTHIDNVHADYISSY